MGYVWAACLSVCQFLSYICINASHYHSQIVALKLRSALSTMIYNKGLVLSNKAKQIKSNGEIVNLMSLDAQKLGEVCQFFHVGWSSIVQVAISLGFIFYLLGWVTFVGIGTMLVSSADGKS
jgi:ATP-binding cassette subfamily C (CFTR/MRP) protein 1